MSIKSSNEALNILGLDSDATREEIKSAYHKKAAFLHPDAGQLDEEIATEAFMELQEAYRFLMSSLKSSEQTVLSGSKSYQMPMSYAAPEHRVFQPKILGGYSGSVVAAQPSGELNSSNSRVIGGDMAMQAWTKSERKVRTDDIEEQRRQERRSMERRKERFRKREEELKKKREEEMLLYHASRAAEVAAKILGFG